MTDVATTEVAQETEIPTLSFEHGLPGFPDVRNFVLLNTELAREPFSILRCLDLDGVEFVVVPPNLFFPDYAPEIDDTTVERLGVTSAEDVLLLVILTVKESAADITANLLAPVVINSTTCKAAQVVLNDPELAVDTPLFSAAVTGK